MLRAVFAPRQLPRTLDAALRDLHDPKPNVRRSALNDLVRLAQTDGRRQALQAVVSVLQGDAEAPLRAAAAMALADAEASSEVPALLEAAEDRSEHVQQMALLALGELSPRGHTDVERVLRAALEHRSGALRFQALLGGQRVVPGWDDAVVAAVDDPDEKIRYLAFRLLDESLPPDDALQPEVERACRRGLRDSDASVRVVAAMLGAARGLDEAKERLVEAINRGLRLAAPQDEQDAIELVGELGLSAAAPGLRRIARGVFGLVPGRFAWQARVALARLGDEAARKEIITGLDSRRRDVRTLAVAAVGQARLTSARSRLETLQRTERADPDALADALRLLRDDD